MDTIEGIDITRCQQCRGLLGQSPSPYFCGEDCQRAWHKDRNPPGAGVAQPVTPPRTIDRRSR